MRPVLVNSNVILDVATQNPVWYAWSSERISRIADTGLLVINPIIYAEVSVRFASVEELEPVLPPLVFRREPIPYEAAFLAGKAFRTYRKRGGQRSSPLPDFFIGAHAAVARYRLLTRDASRYRTYFPTVEIIAP